MKYGVAVRFEPEFPINIINNVFISNVLGIHLVNSIPADSLLIEGNDFRENDLDIKSTSTYTYLISGNYWSL